MDIGKNFKVINGAAFNPCAAQEYFYKTNPNVYIKCAKCGKGDRLPKMIRHQTNVYCKECYIEPLECDLCRENINGTSFRDIKNVICEDCNKKSHICNKCKLFFDKTDARRIEARGRFCEICYNALPPCAECNKQIFGKAYYDDSNDVHYCTKCHKKNNIGYVCRIL